MRKFRFFLALAAIFLITAVCKAYPVEKKCFPPGIAFNQSVIVNPISPIYLEVTVDYCAFSTGEEWVYAVTEFNVTINRFTSQAFLYDMTNKKIAERTQPNNDKKDLFEYSLRDTYLPLKNQSV